MIRLIDAKYTSVGQLFQPLDFSRLAQFFTLDVITDVAFGKCIGFLAEDEDINGYCKVSHKILPIFEWLGVFPIINRLIRLPIIRSVVMPSPTDTTGVGMIMG